MISGLDLIISGFDLTFSGLDLVFPGFDLTFSGLDLIFPGFLDRFLLSFDPIKAIS